ncbi:hypothetical protein [Hansschlegelia zhihuaiae]|uniref:Uncharacterized protein n=1 Tax=Hansschlegelia zhihuaiae TaxID=405005 RepID=A0A4V1KIJ6_9HYPH|nr:hypothetical protein [Hansschlegelia zhihuaiae]RXF70922.1 hypothetical protein EK403_16065 [Hansschlegelia zhihuaiae]
MADRGAEEGGMVAEKHSTSVGGADGNQFSEARPQNFDAEHYIDNVSGFNKGIYTGFVPFLTDVSLNQDELFKSVGNYKRSAQIFACGGEWVRTNSARLLEAARRSFNAGTARIPVLDQR